MMNSISSATDSELFDLCRRYGREALEARRKFLGLLPEVEKRQLWQKHGFSSIFEFAAKLAGVSEEQVRRVLSLEKRFVDKPRLLRDLTEGRLGVTKLNAIAAVATVENEHFWSEKAAVLSTRALGVLVKDERMLQMSVRANGDPQQNLISDNVSGEEGRIEFKEETTARLRELRKRGFDLDALINELLDKRENEISIEKEDLAKASSKVGRYISVKIRRIIKKEYGDKCSVPTCTKKSITLHHQQRFALVQEHDVRFIAPLCKEHHEIAHKIDLKFQKRSFKDT